MTVLAYAFFTFRADTKLLPETVLDVKDLGRLRGTTLQSAFSNLTIVAFRGIPYGKAPVGSLRFRDPEPFGPWSGELDATSYANCCAQTPAPRLLATSEDCLFLNVFARPSATPNRPVMTFFHGGGWTVGCSSSYGPEYLLDGEDDDVVLVSVNYRLGVFGFLSTEDGTAPGNWGLLDQRLALQWIRRYIGHFGGNPDAVTIFGESAGAYAVHHQVESPLSAGLFHRAILQSGSNLCPRALIEGGRTTLVRHARLLNYTGRNDDSRSLFDFMASRTTRQLMDAQVR